MGIEIMTMIRLSFMSMMIFVTYLPTNEKVETIILLVILQDLGMIVR